MEKKEFCQFIQFKQDEASVSANYYWNIYKKYHDTIFFIKPNWITFLFGAFWFFYKRMYLWFIISYFGISQFLQLYFINIGFDRGASGAYSSILTNIFVVLFANALYIKFIDKKIHKIEHLGLHVRLFLPLIFLFRNIVFLLVIQILGIIFTLPSIIKGIYPFAALSFIHCIFIYIYYLYDWKKN